jgi:catechol 2,3-dioxygenase
MSGRVLAAGATMGAVHLTVADLERSSDWYREAIGLQPLRRDSGRISLGTAERELLVLYEARGARPAPGTTGLYHFALLLPRRRDLARWLAHALERRLPLTGMSDHFVSEALYLSDPDEHGIEIYWDRPRELWQGQVAQRLTSIPLDLDNLLAELEQPRTSFERLPEETVMGHVHFRVAEIPGTLEFYRDLLGFGLMAQLGRQAVFLAAGGYHHHVGANTWESAGGRPAPAGAAALRHATLVLPDPSEREALLERLERGGVNAEHTDAGPLVRDPSGNALVLALR